MTEEQIDALIERMKPDIRIAVKAVFEGSAVHIFTFADGHNSATGIQSKIVMFLAREQTAAILESMVNGMERAAEIFARMMKELSQATGNKTEFKPEPLVF